jgi:predicted dehydrogenase
MMLVRSPRDLMEGVGIGIIGAGVRGGYTLGRAIVSLYDETRLYIAGICDVLPARSQEASQFLDHCYDESNLSHTVAVFDTYEMMLDDPACEIIFITSFTNSHQEHVLKAVEKGKLVYLDKPIAVTAVDAEEIARVSETNPLIMGFTRRYEKSWVKAKELLDSGIIGDLQMVSINSVIPYSRYLQTWHRRRELSGGALNDKCSHHFDVFNWLTGEAPSFLTAVGGRSSVFPVEENAPESCRVCDRVCEYRRDPSRLSDGGFVLRQPSWNSASREEEMIDTCVYAPGADISDHAIVSIAYPSGVKASLFFSIFGPDTKDQETLTLVGERGKITVIRHEGIVMVDSDFGRIHDEIDCRDEEFETSHFGADLQLIREVRAFYDGKAPVATATDGLRSLEMVLAAQESIENGGQPVRFDEASVHTA